MKSEVCERKLDTQNKLLPRILDAAACIKKREYLLRLTTRALRTPVAKYVAVDGIFGQLL
jgi:hypothetical protein